MEIVQSQRWLPEQQDTSMLGFWLGQRQTQPLQSPLTLDVVVTSVSALLSHHSIEDVNNFSNEKLLSATTLMEIIRWHLTNSSQLIPLQLLKAYVNAVVEFFYTTKVCSTSNFCYLCLKVEHRIVFQGSNALQSLTTNFLIHLRNQFVGAEHGNCVDTRGTVLAHLLGSLSHYPWPGRAPLFRNTGPGGQTHNVRSDLCNRPNNQHLSQLRARRIDPSVGVNEHDFTHGQGSQSTPWYGKAPSGRIGQPVNAPGTLSSPTEPALLLFLALLRKHGMDIVFPPYLMDQVVAVLWALFGGVDNQELESATTVRGQAACSFTHRELIDRLMFVRDAYIAATDNSHVNTPLISAGHYCCNQFFPSPPNYSANHKSGEEKGSGQTPTGASWGDWRGVTKTKVRGILALLKHAGMLYTCKDPTGDESAQNPDPAPNTAIQLFLNPACLANFASVRRDYLNPYLLSFYCIQQHPQQLQQEKLLDMMAAITSGSYSCGSGTPVHPQLAPPNSQLPAWWTRHVIPAPASEHQKQPQSGGAQQFLRSYILANSALCQILGLSSTGTSAALEESSYEGDNGLRIDIPPLATRQQPVTSSSNFSAGNKSSSLRTAVGTQWTWSADVVGAPTTSQLPLRMAQSPPGITAPACNNTGLHLRQQFPCGPKHEGAHGVATLTNQPMGAQYNSGSCSHPLPQLLNLRNGLGSEESNSILKAESPGLASHNSFATVLQPRDLSTRTPTDSATVSAEWNWSPSELGTGGGCDFSFLASPTPPYSPQDQNQCNVSGPAAQCAAGLHSVGDVLMPQHKHV